MSGIEAALENHSTMELDSHRHHSSFQNNFTALCFDRAEFSRADFNVDLFLAKLRRRGATLEQIRDDARVYLKIIQNSMIELINQDYADFVHLSSNLAGLRGAIEKLGAEADDVTAEFEQTASKIKAAVEDLTKETEEKQRLSSEQLLVEKKIIALSTLVRLKNFLLSPGFLISTAEVSEPEKDVQTISRASYMIGELMAVRNSCSASKMELHPSFPAALSSALDHFQNWLETKLVLSVQNSHSLLLTSVLSGFTACERLDAAQAAFLAQFIEPELRICFGDAKKQKIGKLEQLKSILDKIILLKARFRPVFVQDANSIELAKSTTLYCELDETAWKIGPLFLDDCLLTALLSCLQDRFSSILIPTDATTFRRAYLFLITFAQEWSKSSESNKILKMIFDKFSLLIYYQLCYHEFTSSIDSNLSLADEALPPSDQREFYLKSTSFVFTKLSSIFVSGGDDDDGLCLPPLLPKFWELTCMTINRYGRHILDIVNNFQKAGESGVASTQSLANGDKSTVPKRASSAALSGVDSAPDTPTMLILYYSDLRSLQCQAEMDLLPKILNQCFVENGGPGHHHLKQCLALTFSNLLQELSQGIKNGLIPWLSTQVSSQLASVVEVPRQYRWTRKEAPTQPSAYLSTALDPVRRILEVSAERLSDDTSVIDSILEHVLASVVKSYTENLKSVFDSVEKISSSLSRLKTKGSGPAIGAERSGSVPENMSAVTDEQKIRLQLRLDVEEFEKILNSFRLPVVCDLSEMKALVASNVTGQES